MLKSNRAANPSEYIPVVPFYEQPGFQPDTPRIQQQIAVSETVPTPISPYYFGVDHGLAAFLNPSGQFQIEMGRQALSYMDTNIAVVAGNTYALEWDLPVSGVPSGDPLQLSLAELDGTNVIQIGGGNATHLVTDLQPESRTGAMQFVAPSSPLRIALLTNNDSVWLFEPGYPRLVRVL